MSENITTAYLGIGSNLGDRMRNLNNAIEMLNNTNGLKVKSVSPFYETAPVGYLEQPDFLNGVVEIETKLSPQQLLKVCQKIEQDLKRVRMVRWGPRTIDIDILIYGNLVINEDHLIIPHPRIHEREFVLKPLNDIAPNTVHPVLGLTVKELYKKLRGT